MKKAEIALRWIFLMALGFHLCLPLIYYSMHEHPSRDLLAVGKNVRLTYGDIIFVPGSGCNPGIGTQERLMNAARFYQAKPRPVFISEGTCSNFEREKFYAFTDSLGIDRNMIFWDTTSFNSNQNVEALEFFIKRKRRIKKVLVCTSPYHQRRMMMLVRNSKIKNFKVAAMPDHIELQTKRSPYSERYESYVQNEWKKIFYLGLVN